MAELKEAPKPTEVKKTGELKPERWPSALLEPWNGHNPFEFMRRFAEDMDHLFEDFGMVRPHIRPAGLAKKFLGREPVAKAEVEWAPRVQVLEREGQFVIRADLPGMTKDDIKVEMTEDSVVIQGERKHEKKEERKGYYYNECSYGSFYRSIPLPEGVDATKAAADFRNGVLEISMPAPKLAEKKARQLEIRTG